MPWTMTSNVAQYQGANWANYVTTVPNCPPNQAKLVALQNPAITYFFHCRAPIVLTNGRSFDAGDAVFFSGAQAPWWGSAPQCDGYERLCLSVAYAPASVAPAQETLELKFNGGPAVDVIVVAANLNEKTTPVPDSSEFLVPSAPGPTMWRANAKLIELLQSSFIAQAHERGVAVLLCGLNNHDNAGWSQFQSRADAEQFAQQAATIVTQYDLDGIDIDDEYSNGPVNNESLAMVSRFVDAKISPRPLSKALFQDLPYGPYKYDYTTIFSNLTWGWTMYYWANPQQQLQPYAPVMLNQQLCCGFWSQQSSPTAPDIQWMVTNGYAGVMTYVPAETDDGKKMLTSLLTYWAAAKTKGRT